MTDGRSSAGSRGPEPPRPGEIRRRELERALDLLEPVDEREREVIADLARSIASAVAPVRARRVHGRIGRDDP